MRRASFSARSAVLVAVLIGILQVASAGGATSDSVPGPPNQGPPACSVVPKQTGSAKSSTIKVTIWVQCNYLVTKLSLHAQRGITWVKQSPEVFGAGASDHLSCARTGRREVCSGELGSGVRPALEIRIPSVSCQQPTRKFSVYAVGGIDCVSPACPAIQLTSRTSATAKLGPGCSR